MAVMRNFSVPVVAAISALVVNVSPASAAANYQTFVYINGSAVDVTTSAAHSNGHVYLNSVWIGDLNSANQIIGSQGQLVGYVIVQGGGGN